MKVSQRLFLGVVPSIIGLLTVCSLAYWGQYAHSAPGLVVLVAALASIASLLIAWRNTRYVAIRIERLAAMRSSVPNADELDTITQTVESLDAAASTARSDATWARDEASRWADEYASLISEAAASVSTQLAEARLSLHVLQENRFGDLNDNQEEMINAARVGVEAAEADLSNLRSIADIDRGQATIRLQMVKAGDILRSLTPLLKSRASKKNVRVLTEIEPGLPRVSGDRARLHDALGLIFNDAVTYSVPGTSLSIHAYSGAATVTVVINHGSAHSPTPDLMLAQRLISAQGGTVRLDGDAFVVTLRRTPQPPESRDTITAAT